MTIVQDVVARFTMDTTGAEQGAASLNDKFDGAGSSASKIVEHIGNAGDGLTDVTGKAGIAGAALDELDKRAEGAGASIRGMVTGAIGVAGFASFLDMVKNGTEELQTMGVQFNSTFGGSGQSDLKQAVADADNFGVSIGAAASAYEQFGLSTKGSNQNMQKDMKDFSDIAAGTGESIDQVASSVGNYYQLVQRLGGSGGQASRYATSLLTAHIIDPSTYNQLRVAANQGANPQDLLNMVLQNGESQYSGAGKAQSKTLGGEIQTFRNQFTESSTGAMAPLMNEAKSGLASLNKEMDSSGFKKLTTDVTEFTAGMAKGLTFLAPFGKELASIAETGMSLANHLGPVGAIIGVVVAGFVAFKAVQFPVEILQGVAALGQMGAKSTETITTTEALTAAIREQTAALEANNAAATGGALGAGALTPAETDPAVVAASRNGASGGGFLGSLTSSEGALGLSSKAWMGIGGAAAIGSTVVGSAVGGSTGQMIGTVGMGAGIGTMIEPGVGTAIGAAAGLVVSAFQQSAQAAQQFNASVNSTADKWEKQNPVGSSVDSITGTLNKALREERSAGYSNDYSQAGSNAANLNSQQVLSRSKELENAQGAAYNMHQNIAAIQSAVPGISTSGANQLAQTNNINLSASYSSMSNAITTATNAINGLGGAAEITAEALQSKLANIAAQVGGTYGEPFANVPRLLAKNGTSWDAIVAQGSALGIPAPTVPSATDPTSPGVAANPANMTNAITPAQAQLENANMQATEGLIQAKQGEVQASWAVTQAEQAEGQATFQVTQAKFALTQANFSLSQAEFSLGRANLENTVAQTTQADATAATTTAIVSGYLPANNAVNAALAQVTSLTSAQVSAIEAEVSAYNSLEAQMYATNSSGQSLWSTYMQLQGTVQTLQAQTQQYQNVLNQPLAGTKEFSAQQEQYKVQEASIQQQIDQLELNRVPTMDPRIQQLQQQLAVVQAQSDLSTQVNTQGVGQQQFQIQQASLGPSQSYQDQMQAAQSMGDLNKQLFTANQNLDAVLPAYTAVNTQLSIAQQKNTAVVTSLTQQASADQGVITSANSLVQANNSVVTAQNGVTTASNGIVVAEQNVVNAHNAVTSASWGVQAAASSAAQALNTFNAQSMANLMTYLQEVGQYITNLGVDTSNLATQEKQLQIAQANVPTSIPQAGILGNVTSGKPIFADGGWVPGSGPIDATLHGGEFVLSQSMLSQMANGIPITGTISGGGGGGGNVITLGNGAIQVSVAVSADVNSLNEAMSNEIVGTLNEAIEQLVQKWNGA